LKFLIPFCYTEFMTSRSYNQYCGLSYALDIVGERWTLLIIREVTAGPRRFKDLLDGLPGISTNLLTERLKRLEQQGMLQRRVLPAPAGSTVYELTPLALGLEKAVIELGKWGSQFVPPLTQDISLLRLGSYALTHKTFFRPEMALGVNEIYELHVDDEVLQVQIQAGEIQVQQGKTLHADVIFYTTMYVYLGLFLGQIQPEAALAEGLIHVDGDARALRRFLHICGLPNPTSSVEVCQ